MSYRLALVGACCAVALASCASNQEIAAKRCSSVAGPAYDQCVAQELAKLAAAQQPPPQTGGGGY
jgi:hypothetical protein